VTAPGAPLRPWSRDERGTLLNAPPADALPVLEPENPLASVAPGDQARERDRAVRAEEAVNRTVEGDILNSGMVGGALAMLVGVVLFVLGLSVGCFHHITLVLFVLGFAAFVRGVFEKPRKKYR
jgi:hypothetical protein